MLDHEIVIIIEEDACSAPCQNGRSIYKYGPLSGSLYKGLNGGHLYDEVGHYLGFKGFPDIILDLKLWHL